MAAIEAAKHNKMRFAKIRASICFYSVKNFEVLTSRVFVMFLTKAKEEPKPKSRPLKESKALRELSGAKATVFFTWRGHTTLASCETHGMSSLQAGEPMTGTDGLFKKDSFGKIHYSTS